MARGAESAGGAGDGWRTGLFGAGEADSQPMFSHADRSRRSAATTLSFFSSSSGADRHLHDLIIGPCCVHSFATECVSIR